MAVVYNFRERHVEEDRGFKTLCWIWQGAIDKGYGKVGVRRPDGGKSTTSAHRMYYEVLVGPILEGYHLHHCCGVRACVNPDHVEPILPEDHPRRTFAEIGLTPVPCAHCGTTVMTKRVEIRFCSERCKREKYRRVCVDCGGLTNADPTGRTLRCASCNGKRAGAQRAPALAAYWRERRQKGWAA